MNVPDGLVILAVSQALAVGAFLFKKILELDRARVRAEILAELNAIKTTPRRRVKQRK